MGIKSSQVLGCCLGVVFWTCFAHRHVGVKSQICISKLLYEPLPSPLPWPLLPSLAPRTFPEISFLGYVSLHWETQVLKAREWWNCSHKTWAQGDNLPSPITATPTRGAALWGPVWTLAGSQGMCQTSPHLCSQLELIHKQQLKIHAHNVSSYQFNPCFAATLQAAFFLKAFHVSIFFTYFISSAWED